MSFRITSALTLVVCALVAGCGGDDDEDAGTAGSGGEESPRVAMILPGKASDVGYSQVGAAGLERVEKELGSETAIAESVPVARQVESFRDFAEQGFDVVIGWGGQWTDGAKEVAGDFPDTTFVVAQGFGGNGSNFASVDLASEQWTYLLGYAAGKLTKASQVGVVAGPCFDSTSREIHGYEQGVGASSPDAQVEIVGLDDFDDPQAAKEAAQALIDGGADVLHTNLNTGILGVIEAVQGTEVLLSTQFTDQSDKAPENIFSNDQRDLSSVVPAVVEQVRDGRFDGQPISVKMTAEEDAITPFGDVAPASLYEEATEVQAEIVSGDREVEPDGSCPY